MGAKPNVPNIDKSTDDKRGPTASLQPVGRVIDNPPAKTLAPALKNAERQVDATK
jgi:hypothetical protein